MLTGIPLSPHNDKGFYRLWSSVVINSVKDDLGAVVESQGLIVKLARQLHLLMRRLYLPKYNLAVTGSYQQETNINTEGDKNGRSA